MNDLVTLIAVLQAAQVASKVLHWKTRSFSQHLALDELDEALAKHADRLAEVGIGLDPHALDTLSNASMHTFPDTSAHVFIATLTDAVNTLAEPVGEIHDVLESIIDDLMEDIARVRYKIEQLTS